MNEWWQNIEEIFEKYKIKTRCRGSSVELELPDGTKVKFARETTGIDWFVVRINGKQIHQG